MRCQKQRPNPAGAPQAGQGRLWHLLGQSFRDPWCSLHFPGLPSAALHTHSRTVEERLHAGFFFFFFNFVLQFGSSWLLRAWMSGVDWWSCCYGDAPRAKFRGDAAGFTGLQSASWLPWSAGLGTLGTGILCPTAPRILTHSVISTEFGFRAAGIHREPIPVWDKSSLQ